MQLIEKFAPNVAEYWSYFVSSCQATAAMFLIAGVISFILGLFFGIILTICKNDGIYPHKLIFITVDTIINIFRAIPFLILLIFLIPFTRIIMGTAIGVKGAIVPLVFGAVPFFTRQVETALAGVSSGKIEAARSMGSGVWGIVFRVYLHEAVPDLIRVTVITAISLIGLTTMAGAVGAGGIGSFAINYGQNLRHQDIVNVCVVILLICVWLLQVIGTFLAKKTTNRELFNKTETTKE